MKKSHFKIITLISLFLFTHLQTKAQMVGPDAYVIGTHMEFGVDGMGGMEGVNTTTSLPPTGSHPRSSLGLMCVVANPQKNGWSGSAFDGDFMASGSPENGWGFEIGADSTGVSVGNNRTFPLLIPGSITSWSHAGGFYSVVWEGDYSSATDVHIKINYLMQDTALFFTTSVSVTNNTFAAIPDLYYYKNMDPDNNEEIPLGAAGFTTRNTIHSQPVPGNPIAHVSATQSIPWFSTISLIASDTNWRVSRGGFSNRDASDLWQGVGFTQTLGSDTADEAISIAYRVQDFLPGTTREFEFLTVVDTSSAYADLNSLLFLDFPGEDNHSSFIPDTIKVCGSDSVPVHVNGPTAGDYNWTWSPSTGLSDSTGINVMAYPSTQTTYTVIGSPVSGTGPSDTMFIVAETYPSYSVIANLSSLGLVCSSTAPFALTNGTPAGGIYTGTGVVSGNVYDPSIVGTGVHMITYTVSDSVGCSSSDTSTVFVDHIAAHLPSSLGSVCDNALPYVLTGGAPIGGIYSGPGVSTDSVFNPSPIVSTAYTIIYTVTDSNSCVATDTSVLILNICTGIENNYLNNNVSVFPNPFMNEVQFVIDPSVQLKNTELHVYDVLGKEVMSVFNIQDHEFKMDRKNLHSGMYFYKLWNDSQIITSGKLIAE